MKLPVRKKKTWWCLMDHRVQNISRLKMRAVNRLLMVLLYQLLTIISWNVLKKIISDMIRVSKRPWLLVKLSLVNFPLESPWLTYHSVNFPLERPPFTGHTITNEFPPGEACVTGHTITNEFPPSGNERHTSDHTQQWVTLVQQSLVLFKATLTTRPSHEVVKCIHVHTLL